MADDFAGRPSALDSPASKSFAITPHATNPVDPIPRGIYVGVGGDIVMRLIGDSADVTLVGVPQGVILPVRAQYIRATSTASSLVGLA